MSSFKTNRLIFAISALIIGIILLIWPGTSLMIIGRCIGAVLAAGGIVAGFLFWKDHEAMSRTLLLVMAAVMLICGIVIVFHPEELVKLIPTIAGALAVLSGLINIGETFLLSRNKYGKWWISLVTAALKIAAGIFVIRNAFVLVETIARVAGGVMIFCGGSDLWVISRLFVAEKKAAQADAAGPGKDGAEGGKDVPDAGKDGAESGKDAPGTGKDGTESGKDAPGSGKDGTESGKDAPGTGTPKAEQEKIPGTAAAGNGDVHAADPGNASPSLVWDDEKAGTGPAEVPEYMRQEEQPGEYGNS